MITREMIAQGRKSGLADFKDRQVPRAKEHGQSIEDINFKVIDSILEYLERNAAPKMP